MHIIVLNLVYNTAQNSSDNFPSSRQSSLLRRYLL